MKYYLIGGFCDLIGKACDTLRHRIKYCKAKELTKLRKLLRNY